ncbi:SLC13 family permease [Eubacterium oxidoreducens]|uniref:Solute carrier family 13 (Sodium-dependent dicarboxylate transporter), member 2/3/5 n=1 Tax=Eubacterium oxidoreducens TaxID=1732 RepID=A0A1G6BWV5_EUBOX|nr:SLC13 family permease [Eubacterium oxidoreducens]SDB25116.1 solute carrier family 13 (sodium-dependent dicarboxylate transporter), member 2/3/5 [Eubacterium oxidoreducens]
MAKNKEYIHYLIALIIGIILFVALPANGVYDAEADVTTGGLTVLGVRVIAILVPTLYLWLTTNSHWTSLLALAMLVMTEAMTANEVWAGSMGHFVVITIISYYMLNVALRDTGVINKIAIFFVTRKFCQGKPYAFMAMFFAASLIIGMFMDNMSLAIIFIGIANTLCEEIGIKKGDKFYTTMFLGVLLTNVIYSIASPIAHALPNIIMGSAAQQLGIEITYTDWLAVGIPFAVVMYFVVLLAVRLMNPDTTQFKNFDPEALKKKYPPLDGRGKFAAIVFIIVIAMVILPSLLANSGGSFGAFWTYWKTVGTVVPALLAIACLAIVKMKGEPVLNVPSGLKQLPMPAIIFAGTVSCFANPISNANTGIKVWLSDLLQPAVANMAPFAIVIVLMIIAVIMTNFLSNTVTMVLFFNIGIALISVDQMNMGMFTIIISLAASMASITPSASVPSPLFFGEGYLNMKDTLKSNLVFVILSVVVLIIFGAILL